MEARELRLNNLINVAGGTLDTYQTYYPTKVSIKIIEDILYENKERPDAKLSKYNPIPLTEEWLVRFGFEKIPHSIVIKSLIKNIGRNRQLSVGNIGTPNMTLWLREIDKDNPKKINDLICLWNWDYDKQMYVHTLQNLYFVLTSEELLTK